MNNFPTLASYQCPLSCHLRLQIWSSGIQGSPSEAALPPALYQVSGRPKSSLPSHETGFHEEKLSITWGWIEKKLEKQANYPSLCESGSSGRPFCDHAIVIVALSRYSFTHWGWRFASYEHYQGGLKSTDPSASNSHTGWKATSQAFLRNPPAKGRLVAAPGHGQKLFSKRGGKTTAGGFSWRIGFLSPSFSHFGLKELLLAVDDKIQIKVLDSKWRRQGLCDPTLAS